MSVQNEKTVVAYQKIARKYLANSELALSANKEGAIREKLESRKFIKDALLEISSGGRVLEVGAADGENTKYIQSLGYDVTPSDVADDFLDAMRQNGLKPIRFNILSDDFVTKYDAIFCWKVFVHFTKQDLVTALKKIHVALPEGGILIFNVIDRDCKNVDSEWMDFPDAYHLGENRYFNYYAKEYMEEIIGEAKFEICDFRELVDAGGMKWLAYALRNTG